MDGAHADGEHGDAENRDDRTGVARERMEQEPLLLTRRGAQVATKLNLQARGSLDQTGVQGVGQGLRHERATATAQGSWNHWWTAKGSELGKHVVASSLSAAREQGGRKIRRCPKGSAIGL